MRKNKVDTMREIQAREIVRVVSKLCQEANFFLGEDVILALKHAQEVEESALGRWALQQILQNEEIARRERIPLCQDCGSAVVFVEMGQETYVTGGNLHDAINEGVRQGYSEGYLRKSIVKHSFSLRQNTGDNTPAVVHVDVVPGDEFRIVVMPKGGGAENMSRFRVLNPSQGRQGITDFVVNSVDEAEANPCPPVIIGVGIGGTAEQTMMLAKKALLRRVGMHNQDTEMAALEREILHKVNNLGIGPMGYGGRVTALAVHVEVFPSHIASLPVAVNLQCHSARHKEAFL